MGTADIYSRVANAFNPTYRSLRKNALTKETVDVLEAYCVGLHNAEDAQNYGAFLEKCCDMTKGMRELPELGEFYCNNYARLQHLKLYKDRKADLQPEWDKIEKLLAQWDYPVNMCRISMEAAGY